LKHSVIRFNVPFSTLEIILDTGLMTQPTVSDSFQSHLAHLTTLQ